MSKKRILIVDDEDAILVVLKNSLKKLGPDFAVSTATSGESALQLFERSDFDMVVTDYRMVGMNGLELIEAIHAKQPQIPVILMSAYGTSSLEEKLQKIRHHEYMKKPLEIEAFRQIVKNTLEKESSEVPSLLVIADSTYREIHDLLNGLKNDIGARCIFLTNAEGNLVSQVGNANDLPLEQIASLVGGGIAALFEAGRVIDGDQDTINFTYRESKQINLYALNVNREWLLSVVSDNGTYSSKLGSVWYYARQAVVNLREILKKSEQVEIPLLVEEKLNDLIDLEFDSLIGNSNLGPITNDEPTQSVSKILASQLVASQSKERTEATHQIANKASTDPEKLYSFDEAIKAGLIQWSTMDGIIPQTS